jgi:hypothetical protein
LPNLFAHKIRQVLCNEHNVIDYDTLTYRNIISAIQKEGLRMCIDMKISNQANNDKRKAKYEMRNFCEQYSLPSVAPFRRHKLKKSHNPKDYSKMFKRFKKRSFEPNEYYKKREHKHKSQTSKPKQQKSDKPKSGCYKCGKLGHFARDCKLRTLLSN